MQMWKKTMIIALTVALCMGIAGCSKPGADKNEEHNVTLPVISQGNSQEEEKPQIPVVSEEEAYKTMLVNITHPLSKDYTMELVTVAGYKMDVRAADAMQKMLDDAKAEGLDPIICSAYRSIDRQITLFKNQVKKQQGFGLDYDAAFEKAKTVVAYPGTSEHHTGLAADIVARSHQVLDDSQENTAEQQWLMANSWKYGYILRYPSDKSDLTKIIYEPWHYRYVGEEVAAYLYENDLCLEEYWLQLAEQDPEQYGYILEEITPEQIVVKQEPAPTPAPPANPPATEEPSSNEGQQGGYELDDSFTQQQQDRAAGEGTVVEDPAQNTQDENAMQEDHSAAVDKTIAEDAITTDTNQAEGENV